MINKNICVIIHLKKGGIMCKKDSLILVLGLVLASQLPAHAYLDPGTGSLVLQILLAMFAGIIYWVKIQWHNIKVAFQKIIDKKNN